MNASLVVAIFFIVFIVGFGSVHNAFAQGTKTAGGVDVDGTWYAGEGLKKGDYFVYRLCELDLNDCAPFDMKMWVRGETTKGTETLWDFEVVVIDGSKIVKGDMQVGKTAPEPVGESEDLFDYSRAYRSSIVWLSAFATGNLDDLIHGPQAFRDPAWGKVGAIGGSQLIPFRAEKVTVPAGTFDTVVVGWYSGLDNEIWIKDDFPFPVKALVYAWVTTGIAPVQYEFALLEYKENVVSSPFTGVVSTVEEKELVGCPEFYDYVKGVKSTDTFTMIIEYNYGPENPMTGCEIEWKINFKNKFNQVEFVNQVHYDIVVVDDNNVILRSIAEEEGRPDLFNGFGQLRKTITVKEPPGIAHYALVVLGTGAQQIVPDATLAGILKFDIEIVEGGGPVTTEGALDIPGWIKNNAGWWSNGQIGDSDFVLGIQYLINQGIMKIPSTSAGSSTATEIPSWIKKNADWWANGQISDADFVSGIQWLITNGIIVISS